MERHERVGVWLLAIGQTLGFTTLLFSFGAILLALEAGTPWSRTELALGPSLGLGVEALVVTATGRLVDRGQGGALLAGSALLGAVALAALSQVQSLSGWYALWAVLGVAQAAGLYETCRVSIGSGLSPLSECAAAFRDLGDSMGLHGNQWFYVGIGQTGRFFAATAL